MSGEKARQKKQKRKRLGRGTLNTCAKLQVLSHKNGVDIGLKEFWAFMLEQVCRYSTKPIHW